MILSISENTVNFHQKNMQRKFNAPNKNHFNNLNACVLRVRRDTGCQ